ncbi:MAG TPA: hypothetical protein VM118_13040 [Acidobacteriota bacterium]|nr:hypothetical protein [Acidobacteriota bacterium]
MLLPATVWGTDIRTVVPTDDTHVGETITITVEASRDTSVWGTSFSDAALIIDEHWRPGGQTVGSEKTTGDRVTKTWQLELDAIYPGTTVVVPVVYLSRRAGDLDLGRDSVVGTAATIVIWPEPGPARWPWFVGLAVALAALIKIARMAQERWRRSIETRRPLPPPLTEALQMLDEARADRRADRARQYFTDVERIVYGYLSRRLGRALPAATAAEAADLVSPHVGDGEAVGMMRDVLTRCAAARFGGRRMEFEEMARMEETLRAALERLDASWSKN